MDPVTVGVAAAALLATKFGEGIAQDASSSAWKALSRLREMVAAKFAGDREAERTLARVAESDSDEARSILAERIVDAVHADATFGSELTSLVRLARQDRNIDHFIAQAFGNAKQLNIAGDNFGPVNL